jgi:hypothetical protein
VVKPDARIAPTQEEFDAWCEHPTTRFVAAAWAKAAQMQRTAWNAQSWNTGEAKPEVLLELRTRADAYMAFLETGLNDYERILEEDR